MFKKNYYLLNQIKLMQSEIIDNIDNLNSGGCIHFAYYCSKRLTQLKIKHKVLFASFNSKIKYTYDDFESVSHVMVYIPRVGYFDGYKFEKDVKSNYKYLKFLDLNLNILRNEYPWNDFYNTKQNRKLETIINNYIK